MARKIDKKTARQRSEQAPAAPETPIGFDRRNYALFGVSLGLILLGFLFLTSPALGGGFPFIHPFAAGANGFLTMNVAPVLLVLGYCVFLPWAIIARPK
ncbi:MAG: hypothetical protein MUF78_03115 [Candidatus Edwardsbacteria bacterium]|jgi:hypothetical protein|nr:hypothetical protein [Candidatus Edwardsbacteria bacterium]